VRKKVNAKAASHSSALIFYFMWAWSGHSCGHSTSCGLLHVGHSHIKLKDGVNDMTPVTFVK